MAEEDFGQARVSLAPNATAGTSAFVVDLNVAQ